MVSKLAISLEDYHNYLLKRTLKGRIYRTFYLYPILRLIIGSSFVDYGCGIGDFLSFGDRKKCLGLDINPFNISYIQKKGMIGKVIEPGMAIPINSNSVKALVCDQVLEHLDSSELFFNEMRRIFVNKGKLLIGVPCIKGYARDPDHKIFYDENKLKILLERNSFKIKKIFYLPLPFSFLGKFMQLQSLYILAFYEK